MKHHHAPPEWLKLRPLPTLVWAAGDLRVSTGRGHGVQAQALPMETAPGISIKKLEWLRQRERKKLRQEGRCEREAQPGLHIEFKARLSYTERSCLQKKFRLFQSDGDSVRQLSPSLSRKQPSDKGSVTGGDRRKWMCGREGFGVRTAGRDM